MDLNLILNSSSKRSTCPECFKQFSDASTALRHFKHVHTPPFICPYCDKSLKLYGRPKALKLHYSKCKKFILTLNTDDLMQIDIEVDRHSDKDYERIKNSFKGIARERMRKKEKLK